MAPIAFDCPLCCNETFTSKDSLKQHLLSNLESLHCNLCNLKCSDITELVEHLGENCEKYQTNVHIKTEEQEQEEETEYEPQYVSKELLFYKTNDTEANDTETNDTEANDTEINDTETNDTEANDNENIDYQDETENEPNESNDQYSCLACDMTFTSLRDHLDQFHEGEDFLLEDEEGDEIIEEAFEEVEETNQEVTQNMEEEHQLNGEKEETNASNNLEVCDPIVEKYLFCNGEVRLINEDEVDGIADKSLISEILRCPRCTLKFPNINHYQQHRCPQKSVVQLMNKSATRKTGNTASKGKAKENANYKCTICQYSSTKLEELKEHMDAHLLQDEKGNILTNTVQLPLHVCDICNTKFPTVKSLRLHAKMHKPIQAKEVEAPVDYNIMGESIEGADADESVVNPEMFECGICNTQLDVKYKEVHIKSHVSNESDYICTVCNKIFFSQTNLEMHMTAHSDVKKFSCSYCKRSFTNYSTFENHAKKCVEKAYACQFCGRRFSKPHEKVKHERIHTGEKPYKCQVCGKAFRVSFCLTLHMRTHSGARPYECLQCGKRFKSNGVYQHHIKTHSEDRNYKCPYCAKAFKTAVQLSSHKNSHTKPFSCTECNRPFSSLYAVRAHMATHQKENNLKYHCWLCGATYARSFALKDHMNSVHMDYSIKGRENAEDKLAMVEEDQGEEEYEEVEYDAEAMEVQEGDDSQFQEQEENADLMQIHHVENYEEQEVPHYEVVAEA